MSHEEYSVQLTRNDDMIALHGQVKSSLNQFNHGTYQ